MAQNPRRSGPKVKTGCKTCKVRRIKCDELRPSCKKCTSTGRKCDGYSSPIDGFHLQIWHSRRDPGPLEARPLFVVSDEGARYLEFYYHCAQPMLSTNFDREFWSRTTLQMACSEPAVRHALIALGYLHSTEDGSMRHARSSFASQRESGILLRHYNKSVRSLADRMSETTYKPEIGLVTCLLFICMEFLRGNYHTAFSHLTSGLKLISVYSHPERHDSPVGTTPELFDSSPKTSRSRKSALLVEELIPLFHRAMASAMLYGVRVEDFIPIRKPDERYYEHLRIDSIRELELSAHELRNQSVLHIRQMSQKRFFLPDAEFTNEEILEQRNLLICQNAWHNAMIRFQETRELSATDELVVSTALMHWHCTNIWTACITTTNEMDFDDHLPAFQTILHLATRILQAMEGKPGVKAARFSFEISVIPGLSFIAQRCRCPTTRREAVTLLERKPPREGLFDAQQSAMVSRRLIEIEEKELDAATGWPVARTRLWSSVIDSNMDQRGGFWAYFMKVHALHARKGLEQPVLMQEFFTL